MKLRDYQISLAKKGFNILNELCIVYYVMSPRTGKSHTALYTAYLFGAKKVLFITKKKAISSIISDFSLTNYPYKLTVINNESLHTITSEFDLVISDEHHRLGAFPKLSKTTKEIKQKYGHLPMIFLSGTPATESVSQWFHQFWVSNYSPFRNYSNFYKWSKDFVNVAQKQIGAFKVNDYTNSIDENIQAIIEPYLVKYTQEDAGFQSKIIQNIIHYPLSENLQNLVKKLKKDLVLERKNEVVLADTSVKLMQKIHQIENGTIKFDSGNAMTLSSKKAEFIKENFKGKKIAIFYYFIQEFELLKSIFTEWTNDLEEFKNSDKTYIGQQYTNSLGVNLSSADALVFYNFGYSGVNYIQAIDRLTTIDREQNDVYFVFAKGSLSEKIYKTIKDKKNYSDKLFKKDYGI